MGTVGFRAPFKKHLPELPVEEAHGGSGKRQLILSKNDSVSGSLHALTKGFLQKGEEFGWHSHEGVDEFFLVFSGSGRVEFEGCAPLRYAPNDVVYVPSSMRHKMAAESDSEFFFVRIDG